MEGAQDAKAVLSSIPSNLSLRLLLTQPGRGKRWQYLSLLWLPVSYLAAWAMHCGPSVAAGLALGSWLVVSFWVIKRWPCPQVTAVGLLTSTPDELHLVINNEPQGFSLNDSLRVHITYQGFKGEQLAPRIWASGLDNFIQLNEGEVYRFEMPTAQSQELLRAELRRWYRLKVHLKEYRRDGPTFLLHRDLSYEQIQTYKREFGVSLYG